MCVFGYLKIPDIILSLVSSQKLDWTHTFGTYCIYIYIFIYIYIYIYIFIYIYVGVVFRREESAQYI